MPWRAAPADVDEGQYLLDRPLAGALNVALAKAGAVEVSPGEVIVAADTLVVAEGKILGKPGDADTARNMLRGLRARPHAVLTGVVLRTAGDQAQWGGVVSTQVTMRDYAEAEIDDYIGRGEPFDKAGAYAIQDTLFRPVAAITGCYLNVVGLPLCAVAAGLAALGVDVHASADRLPPCGYCRQGAESVKVGRS